MITLDPLNIARWTEHRDILPGRAAEQRLLQRAALLSERDQLLFRLVFIDHIPIRRVGQVLSLPPGTVSRRARRMHRRLHQPIVAALLSRPHQLTREQLQLAIDYFVRRVPVRHIAAALQQTPGQVRRTIEFLRGWLANRPA